MRKLFLLVVLTAAAFVWLTSADLPPVVASHFGPGGIADSFMGRGTYRVLMLALVIVVPFARRIFGALGSRSPDSAGQSPEQALLAGAGASVGFA